MSIFAFVGETFSINCKIFLNFEELVEKYPVLYENIYDLPITIEGIGSVEMTYEQGYGELKMNEVVTNDWVSGPIFRISITVSTSIDNGADMINLFHHPYQQTRTFTTQSQTERPGDSYIDGEAITFSYTATELQEAGFTLAELMTTGFTRDEIIKAGFTLAELKAAEFTLAELIIHNGPDPVIEALANLDQNNGLAFTNFVQTVTGYQGDGTGLTSIDVVLPETPG